MKSVSPEICEKVATGDCTVLMSKTAPKCDVPFKDYIYCTKSGEIIYGDSNIFVTDSLKRLCKSPAMEDAFEKQSVLTRWNGKVIGEFVCDKIDKYTFSLYEAEYRVTHVEQNAMCFNQPELIHYGKGKPLYGWHISDLKIYDKPKELSEFHKCGAKTSEELCDTGELCEYCNYRPHGLWLCEGNFCGKTYEAYLDENFALTRPPQSYMYVEEL